MASFSINLLHSRPRKDGKKQIIANIHARGNAFIHSKIHIHDSEWDANNRTVIGANARAYNITLGVFTGRIQHVFNALFAQGQIKTTTAKEIKYLVEKGGQAQIDVANDNSIVATHTPNANRSKDKKLQTFLILQRLLLSESAKRKLAIPTLAQKIKCVNFTSTKILQAT